MSLASSTEAAVVDTSRTCPFLLWLVGQRKPRRSQTWAAAALGISRGHLNDVLSGRQAASRELYADMARLSRGKVTIRELEAWRAPSDRPRRLKPKPRLRIAGRHGRTGSDRPITLPEEPEKRH